MRLGLAILSVILLFSSAAAAQVRGRYGNASARFAARSPSAASGFGSIIHPGTGGPPPLRNNATFARRYAATVGRPLPNLHVGTAGLGRNLLHSPRPTLKHRYPARRTVVYPVAYPVYYGGYNYATPQQPVQVTVHNVQPQPSVIINQYYQTPAANPVLKNYSKGDLPETPDRGMKYFQAPIPTQPDPTQIENVDAAGPQASIILIAYKDQTIYPAVGYWVEEGTLHYLTTSGSHNRASLELIDEDLSLQLNQERGVEFQLEER